MIWTLLVEWFSLNHVLNFLPSRQPLLSFLLYSTNLYLPILSMFSLFSLYDSIHCYNLLILTIILSIFWSTIFIFGQLLKPVLLRLFKMANRYQHEREYNWEESSHSNHESSFSGFNDSNTPRGGLSGFRLPRQGPSITLSALHSENRGEYLQSCGFGFIVDKKTWSCSSLQSTINSAWELQGQVKVNGRGKNRFLIKFSNMEDLNFLCEKGPWSLNNSVFTIHPFIKNQVLEDMHVLKFHVWLQVWGLPLDHFTRTAATLFGNIVGDFYECEVDEPDMNNIRFLRVRATIDPALPLIMGCHVNFSENNGTCSSI